MENLKLQQAMVDRAYQILKEAKNADSKDETIDSIVECKAIAYFAHIECGLEKSFVDSLLAVEEAANELLIAQAPTT